MSHINALKFHIFKRVGSFGKVLEPDSSDPNRPENRKYGILRTNNRTMILIYGSVPVRFLGFFLDTPTKSYFVSNIVYKTICLFSKGVVSFTIF